MKVNLDEIEKRIVAGLIRRQWTEDCSLMILNYTQKCNYDKAWDEYTVLTRGLILRPDGTIHSRSLKKFWNLNEPPGPSLETLPQEVPEITLKQDGYLGVSYWHDGEMKVASRGSFSSEYALWATEWLKSRIPSSVAAALTEKLTLVFEILYPHRRIVVDNAMRIMLAVCGATGEMKDELPNVGE